jgi:hypothetical protein
MVPFVVYVILHVTHVQTDPQLHVNLALDLFIYIITNARLLVLIYTLNHIIFYKETIFANRVIPLFAQLVLHLLIIVLLVKKILTYLILLVFNHAQ